MSRLISPKGFIHRHPTKKVERAADYLSPARLSRFAAMDSFVAMLSDVSEDADAYPVAEMLRRRSTEYRQFKKAIPPVKLHPAIRQVRDELPSE